MANYTVTCLQPFVHEITYDTLPAMYRDGPILSKLLLGFMNLANKIDESLSGFGYTLFWPISKLELPYCPGLAILQNKMKIRWTIRISLFGKFVHANKEFDNSSTLLSLKTFKIETQGEQKEVAI